MGTAMDYNTLRVGTVILFFLSLIASKLLASSIRTGVPLIGPDGLKARANFYRGRVIWIEKGYRKFKDQLFRLWTPDGYLHMLSIVHMKELKPFEDDHITISALKIGALPQYTGVTIPPICFRIFPHGFSKGVGRLVPTIVDEAKYSFGQNLPPCEDWTSISIFQTMTRMVATVNGLVLSGSELNRNPEWISVFVNFTGDVFRTAGYLKLFPIFLRPVVVHLLPSMKRVRGHYATAHRLADPVLEERAKASQRPDHVKPNDFMQWLQDGIKAEGGDYDVAKILMSIGLAGVHTTAITCTQAIHELAARPEHVKILRSEIKEALEQENGVLSKDALYEMKKLDSFMKETQRLNPISQIAWIRRVEKHLTLKDDTHISPGMLLAAPALEVAKDPKNYVDPQAFDPLRFYHLRNRSPEDANLHNFTTVNAKMLPWGYGKHACPGRFVASMQIKAMLALLIKNYDIKLNDGAVARPKNLEIGMGIIPDPKAMLQLRRRKD